MAQKKKPTKEYLKHLLKRMDVPMFFMRYFIIKDSHATYKIIRPIPASKNSGLA